MLLKLVGKDYLWGGTRLKKKFNKDLDLTPLAEYWECSVHPDGQSVVSNEDYKGRTLADVLNEYPDYLGTKTDGELLILAKFIDAQLDLSVQVHPDDEYARVHEHQNGKSEMWYVLDAQPGSSLVIGFAHDVTEAQLRDAVEAGTLSKHLQKIPVRKGDIFYTSWSSTCDRRGNFDC